MISLSGQITATTIAGTVADPGFACSLVVQNDPASTVNAYVGSSTVQQIALVPGQSITLTVPAGFLVKVRSASATCLINYWALST